MKKILFYFFSFICICFVLPAMFTKRSEQVISEEISNEVIIENNLDNGGTESYKKIKLLHASTNQVEELDIDQYLYRSGFGGDASKL